MNDEMECMCLQCGISIYLDTAGLALESVEGSDLKVLRKTFCTECGGPLTLVGKAGDEPHYRLA